MEACYVCITNQGHAREPQQSHACWERVRPHCELLRRSTTANHMLKEKQRLLQTTRGQADDGRVTRVCAAHDMLERFLEQQPAICAALLSSEVRKTEKDLCHTD
ncbi:hypothetical protein KUCAC02_032402 [Chaenocephalus aceratus]|nr:hypothetical protein KUCAC02_032402 [Chaenocephalus aceratus]